MPPHRDRDDEHHHPDEHLRPEGRDDCREPRARKIVERTWYFGDDDDDCHGGRGGGGGGHGGGAGGGGGHGRPTRPPGKSCGKIYPGVELTVGFINQPNTPGEWCGPRPNLDLPYLF